MPLFSAQASAAQKYKHNTATGANKPRLQTVTDHQPQAKTQHNTAQ